MLSDVVPLIRLTFFCHSLWSTILLLYETTQSHNIVVGTGKSMVTKEIVKTFKLLKKEICSCAPTGMLHPSCMRTSILVWHDDPKINVKMFSVFHPFIILWRRCGGGQSWSWTQGTDDPFTRRMWMSTKRPWLQKIVEPILSQEMEENRSIDHRWNWVRSALLALLSLVWDLFIGLYC